MYYIVSALLAFILAVGVHIFFCRKTTAPGLHAKAFMGIALILLIGYALLGAFLGPKLSIHSIWAMPFYFTAAFLFILMVPLYLCFYTLTQLMSPSKKILLSLSSQGPLTRAQILKFIKEENFIGTRLDDLMISGCVRQEDNRYILNASGQKIALMLQVMQLMLGRPKGG